MSATLGIYAYAPYCVLSCLVLTGFEIIHVFDSRHDLESHETSVSLHPSIVFLNMLVYRVDQLHNTEHTPITTIMTITSSDLNEFFNHMGALDPAELQTILNSWTLTPDQMELLRQLADRFLGPQASSQSTPSPRPVPASNNPWRAFHRCDRLALHEVHQDLLSSGPYHFVTSYGDATIHDGCMSASRSAQQQSVQRLRELFIALALYDIVRSQYPRFSGNRLSDRMKDQVKSLLPQCDVIEQYRMGKNLDSLCKRFGMGCVLYLADYLSKDL